MVRISTFPRNHYFWQLHDGKFLHNLGRNQKLRLLRTRKLMEAKIERGRPGGWRHASSFHRSLVDNHGLCTFIKRICFCFLCEEVKFASGSPPYSTLHLQWHENEEKRGYICISDSSIIWVIVTSVLWAMYQFDTECACWSGNKRNTTKLKQCRVHTYRCQKGGA